MLPERDGGLLAPASPRLRRRPICASASVGLQLHAASRRDASLIVVLAIASARASISATSSSAIENSAGVRVKGSLHVQAPGKLLSAPERRATCTAATTVRASSRRPKARGATRHANGRPSASSCFGHDPRGETHSAPRGERSCPPSGPPRSGALARSSAARSGREGSSAVQHATPPPPRRLRRADRRRARR